MTRKSLNRRFAAYLPYKPARASILRLERYFWFVDYFAMPLWFLLAFLGRGSK